MPIGRLSRFTDLEVVEEMFSECAGALDPAEFNRQTGGMRTFRRSSAQRPQLSEEERHQNRQKQQQEWRDRQKAKRPQFEERRCRLCERAFTIDLHRDGVRPIYCSMPCKWKAIRLRAAHGAVAWFVGHWCPGCGGSFIVDLRDRRSHPRGFCSHLCRLQLKRIKAKEKRMQRQEDQAEAEGPPTDDLEFEKEEQIKELRMQQMDVRSCKHPGCAVVLDRANITGYCRSHHMLHRPNPMHNPETVARNQAAQPRAAAPGENRGPVIKIPGNLCLKCKKPFPRPGRSRTGMCKDCWDHKPTPASSKYKVKRCKLSAPAWGHTRTGTCRGCWGPKTGLVSQPEGNRQAWAELRDSVTSRGEKLPEVSTLPDDYLSACVDEVLRRRERWESTLAKVAGAVGPKRGA